jgi:RNA polymerase sigma factor (sigma-70 family)
MRARFDAALQGYIDGQTESRVLTALRPSRPSWQSQPWLQFAGAAALLVLGVALGRFVVSTPSQQPTSEIALLREELRDTRQMVTLSLLQQQSASERLKGVTTSSQLEQPSTEVVSALLETLKRDPNVIVRLARVDALRRIGNRDAVRKSGAAVYVPDDEMDWASDAPGPASLLERARDMARLKRALQSLREDRRELIVMVRYQGMTHEQVGAVLGVDGGTVKVRFHRALKELRDAFAGVPGGD